jgi:trehalose-phosphatase
VAAEVRQRLEGRHLLLLTDFDGTLAELAPTPAEAVMSDAVRAEFDALSTRESVTTGVVSGRRLEDVRARVGAAAQFVAGLHGLEILGPAEQFRHQALDTVEPVIGELFETASRRLAWCRGAFLENKTYALACHVRLAAIDEADAALDQFVGLAEAQLEAGILRLLTGSKAVELLPSTTWNKGRAVDWIRTSVARRVAKPVSVVYLGDDRTDEDAFASLRETDMAIGIGPRPHTHLIDWRLTGPASAGRFFERLRA